MAKDTLSGKYNLSEGKRSTQLKKFGEEVRRKYMERKNGLGTRYFAQLCIDTRNELYSDCPKIINYTQPSIKSFFTKKWLEIFAKIKFITKKCALN